MSDSIRIDTPENVDLLMEPAGLGSRFVAAVIDGLVQWGIGFLPILVTLAFSNIEEFEQLFDPENLGGFAIAILLLLWGVLFSVYKLLLEAVWNGQTVGKRTAGIRVVQHSGLPVTFFQVLIRNLMRVVDFLPLNYLIGCVCILATRRSQRLGDIVAGTVVVRERKAAVPAVPQLIEHEPATDLNKLREYVRRLSEADLNPARGFYERRDQFEAASRARLAQSIAEGLAARMSWPDPLPQVAEQFILEVLYLRAN